MSGILKFVLSKESIYERVRFYKEIIHDGFLVTEKIPILYRTKFKRKFLKILGKDKIENESFNGDFGVIYLFINELEYINEIENKLWDNIYFDFSYKIKFDDVNLNFNSCVTSLNNSTGLTGEGVVIAFLDTGIDYTLNAFRNYDGTTKIKFMYEPNTNKFYNSDQINSALKLENPFTLIEENDFKGHGTAVASIACAGGNIDKNLFGVAPNSQIISVNITTNIDSLETLFHTVIKGLDFLLQKQKEENFPLVVNLSFSTNFGSHTGRSLLEEYVQEFALNKNISVVVSAGNEGGAGHHKSGKITLEKSEEINLEISGTHKSIPISLYKSVLTDLFIKITSPRYGSSSKYKILEGIQTLRLGGDEVTILFTGPTNYNVTGDIEIIISSGSNEHIDEGIWVIELSLSNENETFYDMWTPITESIGKKTRFLDPDNNNTLGSPATVPNVISVGSYNYRTESVSLFSGRGRLNDLINIKPDVLAPGEDVRAIYPQGRIVTVSGTSFSAPIVSGICALLMEWGIVKGNKKNLYGEVIKYFLIRGATRFKNIDYPNNSYGYGFVCASESFKDITENINNILNLIDDESSVVSNTRKDVDLLAFDDLEIKICSLDVFNDSNRVQFLANINKNIKDIGNDVCIYPLEYKTDNEFIAIMSIPINNLDNFEREYFLNENISIQKSYYYSLCSERVSPITDAGIYNVQNNEYLNLTGRDVIVGIIDTGIDYLHKEFINEIGESRILEIWDQTIEGDYTNENLFGTVYTNEQINSAIKLKENGGDPYSIVPSRDTNGHGTSMAGITSASGYGVVRGGAPSSDLVVVKLKEISNEFKEYLDFDTNGIPIYDEVSIHLALRYLKRVKSKYNKPMVVLIPLQTNGGDHSGNTILENQINDYSENLGFIVVVPSGNQANKQIHTTGVIQKIGEEGLIELFVDKGQRKLRINLYVENFAKASIIIVSPSGERTQKFKLSFGKMYDFKFLFEETNMKIFCEIEENSIGVIQYIGILFNDLKSGIWQIILISEDEQRLKYDAYLTLKEFLRPETKFLNSSSDSTVTSPATARLAVSIAYFNQNYNSIVPESGQGYTLDGRVCPNIAAGGIDVITTGRGGIENLISGSSVAAAVAVGGIALILEWGIVKKNRVQLNGAIIIWLLISSATNPKGYEFPNKYWGYGLLNIRNVFEMLR